MWDWGNREGRKMLFFFKLWAFPFTMKGSQWEKGQLLTSLLTTTHFKIILSLRLERKKKNNIAKSRREEALCASFPLIAFFSIRSNDETSDWGIIKCRKCFLISFLDLSSKSSSLKARQYERMETRGQQREEAKHVYGTCYLERHSGTCHWDGIKLPISVPIGEGVNPTTLSRRTKQWNQFSALWAERG